MADDKEPTGSDDTVAKAKDDATPDVAKAKDEPKSDDKDEKVVAKTSADAKVVTKAKDDAKAAKVDEDHDDDDDPDDVDDVVADDKPKAKAKAEATKAKDDPKVEPKKPAKPVNPKAKWILFLVVSVLSLVSDQGTKIWARHSLETQRQWPSPDPTYTKPKDAPCDIPDDLVVRKLPGKKEGAWAPCRGVSSPVIDGYWDWELSMNPGSAFGLFSSQGFARVMLSLVGIGAVFGMLWMLRKSRADQKILHWALALVAGGAVGNLIDRIMDGVVTDFILWHYKEHRWPVFNVADIVLVVGVGLMFIDIQKEGKRDKLKKKRRAERAKAAGLVKKFDD